MPLNQILFHCRTVAIRRIGCKTARHSRAVFPLSCSHCSVLPQFFLSAQHKSSRLLEWSETQTKILRLHQASDFILDNCSSWLTNLCCLVSWQWSHELYSGNDTNEASWQKEKGILAVQIFSSFLWNVGAEVKSPFVLCCSYDCNIERGLRLFAFHPSVLKELASLWMCVTDKGARWLFLVWKGLFVCPADLNSLLVPPL